VFLGSPWSWRELKLVLIHIITIQKLFLYTVLERSMNTYALGLDVCQCYGHQTWKWMWFYKVNVVDQKHCKMDKILSVEDYNIQEHEDWYRVEDNDSLRMIQEKPSKIVINERLHYMIILNINPFWKNIKIYRIH
jgi:hypothetical protein